MTAEHYVAEFERRFSHADPARRTAIDAFAKLGIPTGREESWRFTPLDDFAEIPFALSDAPGDGKGLVDAARGDHSSIQLVFVDGHYCADLTALPTSEGVHVGRLREVHGADGNAFEELNAAFWRDGAEVRVSTELREPIHLLFLSSERREPTIAHPRIQIVLEFGAVATVLEDYVGPAGGVYCTNVVTEIRLEEAARLDYYKLQRESKDAFHFATIRARLGRDSVFVSHSISLGARLSRNDLGTTLDGEGAEVTLSGLYETTGGQLADSHTFIDHAKPHTTSREVYKGVLDGQSRGVFDGRILVRPDAQKTNAIQTNKNLLLSKDALVHTKPQLEIFANDVKCKHGATIGQLDRDVLFYLRSRGIGLEEARRLLIHAFASEIVDEIKIDSIRAQIAGCLFTRVPGYSRAAIEV